MENGNTLRANLKKKLENGEISQSEYDELMKKFEDLDLLSSTVKSRPRNYSFTGSQQIEGGEVSQPVKVSGKLRSLESLTCPRLSISGSASIDGDLTVVEASKISGKLNVDGNAKFGGSFKLSGKTNIAGSSYFTDTMKVSGKFSTGDDLIIGNSMKVSGKLKANSIQSTSTIKLSGKVKVDEDVEAVEFITSGGGSYIGRDLKAEKVEIAKRFREKYTDTKESFDDDFNEERSDNLGSFIENMVTNFIPRIISTTLNNMGEGSPPSIFTVENNIEGKDIDISYTHVKGDVIGDNIIFGPEVQIDGKIMYRDTIQVPEDHDYIIEKIE